MNESIFSISVSTNTLVEERSTSTITTTINRGNMSSDDQTPGTSSSSYSNSSNSSSAENISTVENGDLSIFTFMTPGHRSSSISPDTDSSHHNRRPCDRHHSTSSSSCSCHCCCDKAPSHNSSPYGTGGFSIDPFRLDGSHMYSYKGVQSCQNHILSDNFVRLLPRVSDGILLRSLEKGVLFPVVHWSSKSDENLTQNSPVGHSVVFNQGVYRELKRVIPPDVWLHREGSSSSKRPTWLIIGYKSLEKTLDSSLEATWKEWTGARHIYLNLRHDFEMRKISFLNRIHPQDNLDLFMYLVLVEIGNVDDTNLIWLLDFVQRTRVERMKGFITVYTEVEQEIPSIDEYLRYLSSAPSKSKQQKHTKPSSTQETSSSPSSSCTLSSSSSDHGLPIVDATLELNGNLRFIEKLLEEIQQPPLNDYF